MLNAIQTTQRGSLSSAPASRPTQAESAIAQALIAVTQNGVAPALAQPEANIEHLMTVQALESSKQLVKRVHSLAYAISAELDQLDPQNPQPSGPQTYQEMKIVLEEMLKQNPNLLNGLPEQQRSMLQKMGLCASTLANPIGTVLTLVPWHHLDQDSRRIGTLVKLGQKAARISPIAKNFTPGVRIALDPIQALGSATTGNGVNTAAAAAASASNAASITAASQVLSFIVGGLSMMDLGQRRTTTQALLDSATTPHSGKVYQAIKGYACVLENEYLHSLTSSLGVFGLLTAYGQKLELAWDHRKSNPEHKASPKQRQVEALMTAAWNKNDPECGLATRAIAMIMGFGDEQGGQVKAALAIAAPDFQSACDAVKVYYPWAASDEPDALKFAENPEFLGLAMSVYGF